MQMPMLGKSALAKLAPWGMDDNTPLWYYILAEAEVEASGERLGSVGGRIVTEVFVGLLEGDRLSYLSQEPTWQPFLPTIDPQHKNDRFGMVDLLRFAQVA